MSITVVESTELAAPYECPLCRRLFYFENDYVKHKCVARKNKINLGAKRKENGIKRKDNWH